MANETKGASATVLFDGLCNLCNGTVRFILANDPSGRFRFASLQSAAGERALRAYGRAPGNVNSIILIDGSGFHDRSTAALRIVRGLRRPWSGLAVFALVPAPLRDALYDTVARNRYRWFGRRRSCALPTPEESARFITDETTGAV